METPDDHPPLEPRLANTDDLVSLCRFLNEAGAKYVVLGGFAIIQSGFARATSDIDLLIDCFGKPNKPTARKTRLIGPFSPNCSKRKDSNHDDSTPSY